MSARRRRLTCMSTATDLARLGYRLGPAAGLGGGGQVFRAVAPDGSEVAVKVGHADDDVAAARAAREAVIARTLPPARFPRVRGHGRLPDGRPWLAMEWIAGDTLAARLGERPWPVADAIAVGRAVALALAAAHERGVIHRDVKPENVMFRADGSIVLVDLGLARLASDPASSATRCAGTPSYMAPEQILGEVIEPATDLYALGGLLYRMLAGRDLFPGGALEVQLAHLGQEPAPLPAPADARAAALHALVRQLLAKRPGQRPASAAVVAATLGRLGARPGARVARGAAIGLAAVVAAAIALVVATPAPRHALAIEVPAGAAPAPRVEEPWAMASAGTYTLRARWTPSPRAGDRLAVTVEVWDDETPIAPDELAATLRDPAGTIVALSGAALRSVLLGPRGQYLLTVFAPDGDITLAVTIPVDAPPLT